MPQQPHPPLSSAVRNNNSITMQELRVADQELHSGDQTGRVFLQLSPGSVAWIMDRPVAQTRVRRQLRQALEQDHEPVAPTHTNVRS